jgi:acyl-homoserine-lactone acylase
MWHIMAADVHGNIGYLDNAVLPVRDPSLDWSEPLRGEDVRFQWRGVVPFEELPQVINPASGWLQNCNDPPWFVTSGDVMDKEKLPFGLSSGGDLGERGRRVWELLSANDRITFEDMLSYARDTTVGSARLWVPRLIAGYGKYQNTLFRGNSHLAEAIALLKSWDCRCDAESTSTAVFYFWYRYSDIRHIRHDSEITEGMVKKQLKDLASVAARVKDRFGRLDIPWGQILYLRHGDVTVPVGGGGGVFAVLKCAYGRLNSQYRIPVTMGSSYMMVVEMSPTPRACSLFPIGISENPASKHFADMTQLYSRLEFKPVYFTWPELEPNVESDEILKTGLAD